MARVTSTLPEDLATLIDGAALAGAYSGTSDVIRDAVRTYFDAHPDVAREVAIHLYETGEVTLLQGARLANESPSTFHQSVTDE